MNLANLKKDEIIKRHFWKCIHGHTGIEHPKCYEEQKELNKRIGFVDIETSNLKATYGIVFAYCIKNHGGSIIKNSVTPSELKNGIYDKRLMKDFCRDARQYDKLIGYYSCMAPEHTILMKDLTYKKLGDVKVGDEIFAFESGIKIFGGRRRYKKAIINFAQPIKLPMVKIKLSDGTELKTSFNHPFLVPQEHNKANWTWKFASDLKPGEVLTRILPEWEIDTSKNSGYLAGGFDGEGWISVAKPGLTTKGISIGFSQKSNIMLEKFLEICKEKNINGIVSKNSSSEVNTVSFDGIFKCFRILGSIRPQRLLNKFLDNPNLCLSTPTDNRTIIISVEDIGIGTVIGLSTSTGTYISNGFASHNSHFDIPFLRSRCVFHNLNFPVYKEIKHNDLYEIIKHKFNLHSKRLGTVCEFFHIPAKHHGMNSHIWFRAMQGDQRALNYILLHCIEDVSSTELLWNKVNDYARITDTSI